jgi:hypothetical protein
MKAKKRNEFVIKFLMIKQREHKKKKKIDNRKEK